MDRLSFWKRLGFWVAGLGTALSSGGVGEVAAAEGERAVPRVERKAGRPETLSSSGQFLAHAPLKSDRALLVTRAEEVREEVARLLDRQEQRGRGEGISSFDGDGASEPLVIQLWMRGDAQPSVHARLYWVEGVRDPVMGVVVARASLVEGEEFRREMVRVLLVKRVFENDRQAGAGEGGRVLPPWLDTGVLAALDHVRAGRPSDRFTALFAQGRILSVEELLTTAPSALEAGAREAYAASACCLVLALLEQAEGPERFRQFVQAIPTRNGSWENLLVRHFPGLALSRHSMEKWWALQAATLATPDLLEPMSASATDAALAHALTIRYSVEQGEKSSASSPVGRWFKRWLPGRSAPPAAVETPGPATEELELAVDTLDEVSRLPGRVQAMRANQSALSALQMRAFPLHRPIIEDYQQVLGQLSLGKTDGLAARVQDLENRRRDVLATAEAANDLLNWYEATQRPHSSGTFDRYFELLEAPAAVPRPAGNDPISKSLDEMEEEFEGP